MSFSKESLAPGALSCYFWGLRLKCSRNHAREHGHLIESAGLLEQMRGSGDDLEFALRLFRQLGHRLAIHFQDDIIVATDDKQSRGKCIRQRGTSEIWTAAAGNHRSDNPRTLGGGQQRGSRARASAV